MDLTWRYWPQKTTTVTKEDGSTEEVSDSRFVNHRLLMLAMHLGVGASMAAYLVNKRRLHVHKVWLLPRRIHRKQGKLPQSSQPEMDVMVKTYSWHAPRSTYPPDAVNFVPSGGNVLLRINPGSPVETFILKMKDALVDGKPVPAPMARELIVNSLQTKSSQI